MILSNTIESLSKHQNWSNQMRLGFCGHTEQLNPFTIINGIHHSERLALAGTAVCRALILLWICGIHNS